MPRLLTRPHILVLAALLFLAAVAAVVQTVLLQSYRELERQAIGQSTEQVVRALEAELRQVGLVGNDYASWDEMYAFVRSADPEFVANNFSEPGMRDLELDAIWVIDEAGREVFSAEQDPEGPRYEVPATAALGGAIRAALPGVKALPPGRLPLLRVGGDLALLSVHPIIRTDRTGPARGQLVMLRRLRPAVVERMSEVSQLTVQLLPMAGAGVRNLPAPLLDWPLQTEPRPERVAFATSDATIAGFAVLRDVQGVAIGWLGTETPRTVYLQGRHTIIVLLTAISVLLALALAAGLALDRRLTQSHQRAQTSEALYRAVVEQAEEGIVIASPLEHRILQVNPALARLTGQDEAVWRGQPVEQLLMPGSVPLFLSALAEPREGDAGSCEIELRDARGDGKLVEFSSNRLTVEHGDVLCLIFRDVSQRKQAEARLLDQQRRLEHLANHDVLTALPNRLYLNFRLPGMLAEAKREHQALAVCYLDVDNFKNINDTSGHDTGDEFLRALAERLRNVVASGDLVARISGDEFVIVSAARDPRVFDAIARRITAHLREPIHVGGRDVPVSVSMGIAVYPQDGEEASELLRNADIALYQAKERGRDNYQFFVHEMNERVRERTRLEQALRDALAGEQIGVEYQPVIDLRSGRIAALEALARWRHPTLGQVPPTQFIPIAEEAGLIVELGEHVLRQVCLQIAVWRMSGVPAVPVAVNVSAQQLQRSNIRDRVLAICSETGIQPRLLQLELTESALMRDIDRQIAPLEGLRAAGVRISIDDFGTGYSSLSYLKHLPIDHLKIDRSFVRDMAVDANDAAIVSAIIGMARSLRLETIAEGVETSQHALRLASLGCTMAQGYYYSGPLAMRQAEGLLLRGATETGALFNTPLASRGRRM
jgi:diguanylate cyclase (GGDEF)-like protein/PAS domain S-box-containing protein